MLPQPLTCDIMTIRAQLIRYLMQKTFFRPLCRTDDAAGNRQQLRCRTELGRKVVPIGRRQDGLVGVAQNLNQQSAALGIQLTHHVVQEEQG